MYRICLIYKNDASSSNRYQRTVGSGTNLSVNGWVFWQEAGHHPGRPLLAAFSRDMHRYHRHLRQHRRQHERNQPFHINVWYSTYEWSFHLKKGRRLYLFLCIILSANETYNWMRSWLVDLMRALKVWRDGELALTHLLSPHRLKPRSSYNFHTSPQPTTPHTTTVPAYTRMASDPKGSPDWTAKSVRDTFLDYFKKNGHTFGIPRVWNSQ